LLSIGLPWSCPADHSAAREAEEMLQVTLFCATP
jgi:hypothetical protein